MNNNDFVIKAKARVCMECKSFYGTPVLDGALKDETINKILIHVERVDTCPECESVNKDTIPFMCKECGESGEISKKDFKATPEYQEFLQALPEELVKSIAGDYNSQESILPSSMILGSCKSHESFNKQQTLWEEEPKKDKRVIH